MGNYPKSVVLLFMEQAGSSFQQLVRCFLSGGNMEKLQEISFVLILALQQMSPALDGVMSFFTFLGSIEFYLIIIPFLYWTVDKRLGYRLLLVLVSTYFFSSVLKLLFHQPRPYWLGKVLGLGAETSYGIPSSHASGSFAIWGYLAYRLNKKWLWTLVAVFVFFIALSRLYLGVHFLHDIILGWLIGFFVLWIFIKYEERVSTWANQKSIAAQIGLGFAISILMIIIGQSIQVWLSGISDPPEWSSFASQARTPTYVFMLAGALFGAVAGYVLMKRYAPFENKGSGLQQLGRYVLGIVLLLILYTGLDILFAMIAADETPVGYALRYIRYASATFLVTFIIPWIFIKIRLAKSEVDVLGERIVRATTSEQKI
jgi:membrane-associated phospholipid phosphatase